MEALFNIDENWRAGAKQDYGGHLAIAAKVTTAAEIRSA